MNNLKFGIEKILVGSFLTFGLLFILFGLFQLSPVDISRILCRLDGKYVPPLSLIFLALSYLLATYGDFFSYFIFKRRKGKKPDIPYEDLVLFYQKASVELFNEINTLRGQDIIFRILTFSLFFDSICITIWFLLIQGITRNLIIGLIIALLGLLSWAVYRNYNVHYDKYRKNAIEYLRKETELSVRRGGGSAGPAADPRGSDAVTAMVAPQ